MIKRIIEKINASVEKKIIILLSGILIAGIAILTLVIINLFSSKMYTNESSQAETLGQSVIHNLNNIMLTQNVENSLEWYYGLKDFKHFSKVEILRENGTEAFYDNQSINEINKLSGEKEYPLKNDPKTIRPKVDTKKYQNVLKTMQTVRYSEMINGQENLTLLVPIKDQEGCDDCHAENKSLRGVLRVSTPLVEVKATINKMTWTIVSLGLVFILLCGVASLFSLRVLVINPVKNVNQGIKGIMEGHLSHIPEGATDEIGRVIKGFNQLINRFNGFVKIMAEASLNLAEASTEIYANLDVIAGDLNEENQKITSIASSIEEMDQSIKSIAGNTEDSAYISSQTKDVANEGKTMVYKMSEGMTKIRELTHTAAKSMQSLGKSSTEISEIVRVIEDIADQTNLLALNAAIEAARAGDSGRGFAVVADEVRKLAEKTTRATKEIQNMVKNIQKESGATIQQTKAMVAEVDRGTSLTKAADETLVKVVENSEQGADTTEGISSATKEQAMVADKIADDIVDISTLSKQTEKKSAENSTLCETLIENCAILRKTVTEFKIADLE